ncbi:MAG: hypothetical protein H7X77_02100, partial [Anaerolineae bacterium]|nr:hypothetical protein [Anaerolineae bacterium]
PPLTQAKITTGSKIIAETSRVQVFAGIAAAIDFGNGTSLGVGAEESVIGFINTISR